MILNLSQLNALKTITEAHITAWQVKKYGMNNLTPYEVSQLREELNRIATELGILHARFHFTHPQPWSVQISCTVGSTIDGDLMIELYK